MEEGILRTASAPRALSSHGEERFLVHLIPNRTLQSVLFGEAINQACAMFMRPLARLDVTPV